MSGFAPKRLTRLRLRNFRGFEDHELSFEKFTLIVGRNNAGKSTIIEALRLVALCTARYRTLTYIDAPLEFGLSDDSQGIAPSMREIEFNVSNLFYRYGSPPSIISVTFSGGSTLTIYITGDGAIFAETRNGRGSLIRSRQQAKTVNLTPINILPQVAPVAPVERQLRPDYIRRAASSLLASSHFRNQLLVYKDKFNLFKELAERNWYKLKIGDFITDGGERGDELNLFIRDDDFVAEIAWMGHGLQIWLQTMWFVARVDGSSSIILDEPDVYLHADLQRRLIRLLKQHDRQSIIATHSVEMISEVSPESVLVVDRKRRNSRFAPSLPAVQKVIDTIGGVHNLHLARMWTSRKVLLVEGREIPFLKRFQDLLFPESDEPIDTVPLLRIGGWGGWNYAVGSKMLLHNSGGDEITAYCILDSDYHLDDDLAARRADAVTRGIELHIWRRKEIENYLVTPSSVRRLLLSRIKEAKKVPSIADLESRLNDLCDHMRDDIFEKYVEEYLARKRPKGTREALKYARQKIEAAWTSSRGKIAIVGGKDLISSLSAWTQTTLGVSVSISSLLRSLRRDDLDDEVLTVMNAIEKNGRLISS